MNERIEQLAQQAGFQWSKFGLVATPASNPVKFAKLIVRDCMDIAANIGEHGPVAAQEMQELFGVEDA